ncbi:MAG: RNA-binding protein [Beijerinckiaceae bacterium]
MTVPQERHDEERAQAAAGPEKSGQERTCALTREVRDPAGLIRFVAAPDGVIVPDIKRKLPGRGVWITATSASVAEAARRNVFARSLKKTVTAAPDLAAQTQELLEADARQSLAMANKAGLVAMGSFQVEKAIGRGSVAALIHASDGSSDGRRKIEQALFRALGEAAKNIVRVDLFDSKQLSLALGHTNVIHAALRRGAATDAFLSRSGRLAAFRANEPHRQAVETAGCPDMQAVEVEDK